MGNFDSKLKICGSSAKKTPKVPSEKFVPEQTLPESIIINRNKDHYFTQADYDHILQKFPKFKEWVDQSENPQARFIMPQRNIKWQEGQTIGSGSCGKVVYGLNQENGFIMAVKQVQIDNTESPAQQERIKGLEMELDLLSRFTHKNIVRYYGSNRDDNTFHIFLEYISGGTISSLLNKYGPFNENLIRLYTRQILEGLEYLHVRSTIHRDIKGANVLVDNNGICKLADFGTAARISKLVDSDMKGPALRGTVPWMAPEILKQTSLGRFCDIWSVGCMVIEMTTGKPPWFGQIKENNLATMYQLALKKGHPPIPNNLSADAVDFLNQCFRLNAEERPNVIKLLEHKFISGLDNSSVPNEIPSQNGQTNRHNPSTRSNDTRNKIADQSGTTKNKDKPKDGVDSNGPPAKKGYEVRYNPRDANKAGGRREEERTKVNLDIEDSQYKGASVQRSMSREFSHTRELEAAALRIGDSVEVKLSQIVKPKLNDREESKNNNRNEVSHSKDSDSELTANGNLQMELGDKSLSGIEDRGSFNGQIGGMGKEFSVSLDENRRPGTKRRRSKKNDTNGSWVEKIDKGGEDKGGKEQIRKVEVEAGKEQNVEKVGKEIGLGGNGYLNEFNLLEDLDRVYGKLDGDNHILES